MLCAYLSVLVKTVFGGVHHKQTLLNQKSLLLSQTYQIEKSTLQFEWRWKQISRTLSKTMKPIERRIMALHRLLNLDRPTTKALPYSEWEQKPHVHMELFVDLFSLYFQESEENPYILV